MGGGRECGWLLGALVRRGLDGWGAGYAETGCLVGWVSGGGGEIAGYL